MSQVSNSGASAKYAIELQGVCKSFRRTQVLSNLTMRVERGKTFAFLGRNGAGKTTTIRMLLGLLNRDQGEVRVLGLDPTAEPLKVRAHVGDLAEDQQMYGWMRVEEIVRFVAPFYATWDHDLALKYLRDSSCRWRRRSSTCRRGRTCGWDSCSRWLIGRNW